MEIKEGTLVVLKLKKDVSPTDLMLWSASSDLGIVKKIVSDESFTVETATSCLVLKQNEVIPLCLYCEPFGTTGEALRAQLPDVVVNLVHMIVDLQNRLSKLEKEHL